MNLKKLKNRPTLLVVEDSEEYAFILQSFLSSYYKVLVANSINSAIEACLTNCPEIIITDLNIGSESGLVLLDKVSRLPLKDQPLAFLSTGTLPALSELKKTKILDTFVKPYCPLSLSKIVKIHLMNSIKCLSINKPNLNSHLKIGYLSKATPAFEGDVESLVANAQIRNEQEAIAGCLFFDGKHFFQFLEGEYQKVIRVFYSIYHDPRHIVTEFASLSSGKRRIFNGWKMERISDAPLSRSHLVFLSKIQEYVNSQQPSYSAKLNKILAQILAASTIGDAA